MREVGLSGGNLNPVVRVGDTVRRATGAWTPAVHALLGHLAERGFGGAPRVLGIDVLADPRPGPFHRRSPDRGDQPRVERRVRCGQVTKAQRDGFMGRQFLNPYALHGYR